MEMLAVNGELPDKASLAEQAYQQLEEKIITLQLPPGCPLNEATLSKELGIGRTPVREALQRLAHEGVIWILPRRGIFVSEIDVVKHLRLLVVRRELERLIARLAAKRANAEQGQRFLALAADFEKAGQTNNEDLFIRTDREFNALIEAVAHNEYAKQAVDPLRVQSRRFWYIHFQKTGNLAVISQLHADVARAVAQNDIALAESASDKLLDYAEEYTRANIEDL